MPGSPMLSRSVLHLSPPFAAASAASFAELRPSRTGWGTRRSPLVSASPPSLRIAISERRCWVVPRRPVAPSIMMPIVRVVILSMLLPVGAGVWGLAASVTGHHVEISQFGLYPNGMHRSAAEGHGADASTNCAAEPLTGRVLALTEGKGADVCFDPMGGLLYDAALSSLGWGGR